MRIHRPRGIGIPIFSLLVGVIILFIAYQADQNARLFALRLDVRPWLRPVEGYVMGSILVLGALYAIARKSLTAEKPPHSKL